jgi:hypothetical protein
MIDYFSAVTIFNENTRYPSSGPYRSWHFPKSDHLNLSGNRGNKFYSNNVWKRDRSAPEVSVFGSENSVHPW